MDFKILHAGVEGHCAQAGDEVEHQELLRAYGAFEHQAEYEQGVHIEEYMPEAPVHEHMGDYLPGMEEGGSRVEHSESLYHKLLVHQGEQEHYNIDQQQVARHYRQPVPPVSHSGVLELAH